MDGREGEREGDGERERERERDVNWSFSDFGVNVLHSPVRVSSFKLFSVYRISGENSIPQPPPSPNFVYRLS